jgi:toxin FitB
LRTLLDTNVLRELWAANGNRRVQEAVTQIESGDLFVSVMTVGEISKGIWQLPLGPKRTRLSLFLAEFEREYADRILPVVGPIAHIWGTIVAGSKKSGKALEGIDAYIAATALHHGLAVMTRNTRDFAATGVTVIDPWAN